MNRPTAPTESWTSVGTLDDIARALRDASSVAILTHAKPDGDAVGSTLALARTLASMGKRATPVYLGPWPKRFDEIVAATPVVHVEGGWPDPPEAEGVDAVVIADTGSWNQVASAAPFVRASAERAMVIDHHSHGDPDIAPLRVIETDAAAAAEIVARLCMDLLGVDRPGRLPLEVAIPLYMGIATDTGWFRFPNTTARTLRLAADLFEAGVDADWLCQVVDQSDSPARLLLMRRALDSLRFLCDHRGAVMRLSRQDFADCGADDDEAGGLIDLPKSVGETRVVAMLTEVDPGLTKVSFRSKAGEPLIDVNRIAQRFGGGGHVHAAGARLASGLDAATDRVVLALEEAIGADG
jgi:phosphoesterase RecJ-like protein